MKSKGSMEVEQTSSGINGTGYLLYLIFRQVFPVWQRYQGKVPECELSATDRAGDFPEGTTALAINRLNKDKRFREHVEEVLGHQRIVYEL